VAVRAQDIALGGFGEDSFDAGAADQPGHADTFDAAFAMIEIHGARRESTATIGAWHLAKLVEHLSLPGPSPASTARLAR